LEVYFCDQPPFDWSTITSSGGNTWRWSDGREYFYCTAWGWGVCQHDSNTGTTVRLADVGGTGLAEGSGYLYGMWGWWDGDDAGISVFRIRVPSLASPDLVVGAVSAPPVSSAPGRLFSVTETVRNEASEPAAPSITRFYLSSTDTQPDVRIGNRYLPELSASGESTGTASVKIPDTLPLGTYRLIACADALLTVAESDDANNCRASATTMIVSRPDFIQSAVSDPPASLYAGGGFTVTDTVSNVGGASGSTSTTRYYLSADTASGGADILLSGSRSVVALAPSAQSTGNRAIVIPATAPGGTYFLLACADDTKKSVELNESNNCRASASRIVVGRPDLLASNVSNPPLETAPGRKMSMTDTTTNAGDVSAPPSATRYYLSLDSLKSASDILLAGARDVPMLTPGAFSTGPRVVTVPSTAPSGTYRVLACADDTAKMTEGSEANNCAASAGMVRVLYPDLTQTSVSNPPPTAPIGGSFTVTDTVRNDGLIATLGTKTRYYLSVDASKGSTDVRLVGVRSVPGVAVNGSNSGSVVVTIPTLATGTYYLLACADDTAAAVESNEANNCLSAAQSIVINP
jgi:subtilase family serine protease